MSKDRKCVKSTQKGTLTCQRGVPSTGMQKEIGEGLVTQDANPPVVSSREKEESPEKQLSRKLPEDCHASISHTTLRCPLTGKRIPPLEEIEKVIEESLTLWNWRWPRSIAVKGISIALQKWALEIGLVKAAKRCESLFSENGPLKYADLRNLPWIPLDKIETLTPEAFADRLGGIVNEFEHGSSDDDSRGDQSLLPNNGSADKSDSGGGEPDSGCVNCDGGSSEDSRDGSGEGGRVLEFPKERKSQSGKREGLSRRLINEELADTKLDLKAFSAAYSCVHNRIQGVKDEGRMLQIVNWSGTAAVMGTLELSIHALERTMEEMKVILRRIDNGVIPNLDED